MDEPVGDDSRAASSGALPRPATVFIGRGREVAQIDAWFAGGATLVTIVGPGGVGKTRLACEAAARAGTPACFVDASEARDAEGFYRAMAAALGAQVAGDARDAAATIGRVLAYRGALLVVVDNVEQLVELAAPQLARWNREAPAARLLVTSREALHVAHERVLELEPLATTTTGAADGPPADAVALLLDRAASVVHTASARRDLAAVAGAIVQRLEGLPLAIELAASRLGVLAPGDLLARLDEHALDVLSRAPREPGAPARRTLRDAMARSWSLLEPDEQRALVQCAVFRGGFTVAAAEAVLAPGTTSVLDVLHALQDKSLLRTAAHPGERRLALYAGVHAFATEQLAASDAAGAAHARHAGYYARLAARYAVEARGPDAVRVRGRFASEADNVLGVLAWAAREGATDDDVALGLATAAAFEPAVWNASGLDALIARTSALVAAGEQRGLAPAARAAALITRGTMSDLRGRATDAHADFERARGLARAAHDARLEGWAVLRDAGYTLRSGRADAGAELLREAVAIFRAQGDDDGASAALLHLGAQLSEYARSDEARVALEEALALAERVGNAWYVVHALTYLALVFVEQGHLADAEAALERAWELCAAADETLLNIGLLRGAIDHVCGRLDAACARLAAAVEAARARGQRLWEGLALLYLGAALADGGGAHDAARAQLDAASAVLNAVNEPRYVALARAWLGALDARAGRIETAAVSLALAEAAVGAHDPLRPAIGALGVALDLARAAAASDPAEASAHRRAAAERLVRARAPRLHIEAHAACHAAARWCVAAGPDAAATPRPLLRVERKGHWFELPPASRVDCRHRQAIRRLLFFLAEAHRDAPGRAVAVDALIAAGWPDERVRWDSARRRLGVSLTRMRALGLRDVLRGDDEGYWFDARYDVALVDDDGAVADGRDA